MLYPIVHNMQYGFIVGKDNILNAGDDGWLCQGIETRNCYYKYVLRMHVIMHGCLSTA